MVEYVELSGTVENIIYRDDSSGYTVFVLVSADDENEEITCTGYLPSISKSDIATVTGNYVNNHKYGLQLNITSYIQSAPSTSDEMERYLASGAVKGIGPRLAKRIIKAFGDNSFEVFESFPEKLAQIKGISLEMAMRFSESFHEQSAHRLVMMLLQSYGLVGSVAAKIYKRYGENTAAVLKHNPYAMIEDIGGVGFQTADEIGMKAGISLDSEFRIRAGFIYTLLTATGSGHVYLPREQLIHETARLLGIDPDIAEGHLITMQTDKLIYAEKLKLYTAVYLQAYRAAEQNVAKHLLDLAFSAKVVLRDIEREIANAHRETGVTLAENQIQAVREAFTSGVLVITGGPGTGKTTTINTIITIMENDGLKVELCAPTGRAAKRMSEATGREAKTIHRMLEAEMIADDIRHQIFARNEDNPIEADVLIVDECSMIDIMLMNNLLRAVSEGTRLILVGDVDQLPSVGPGKVLKDIISSGVLNTVRLTEIFRQSQESAIVMNAHRINRGEYPVINERDTDFFFMQKDSISDVIETLTELYAKRLPKYKKADPLKDIQLLTPMRKADLGVNSLNKVLQQHLNPTDMRKREREFRNTTFREGDKVMQIKNNYERVWKIFDGRSKCIGEGKGVFNGDMGIISKIDLAADSIAVLFDDNRTVLYDAGASGELEEIELAYAITVHKSQGSEYRIVIIPIHSGPSMLMSRNLLYTAVTRAKELVVLVGTKRQLYAMIENKREVDRNTALCARIQDLHAYYGDS